jgi:hypothetical protein
MHRKLPEFESAGLQVAAGAAMFHAGWLADQFTTALKSTGTSRRQCRIQGVIQPVSGQHDRKPYSPFGKQY